MLGPMPTPEANPKRPRAMFLALLLLTSSLLTLAGLEAAIRVLKGVGFSAVPDPAAGISMIGRVYPGSFDPNLGYVPTPGARAHNPIWNATAHITWEGTRSNGADAAPPRGVPIVTVGDSFTYGDEVNDRDTWPAKLQGLLARPIVNGGVFGYGFDQAVLRSEVLMQETDADFLIVSLIADDIDRCEYSYRYSWKPYFDVEEGALVRRNMPVPSPQDAPIGESYLRRALRKSYLADFVLRRLDPSGWLVRGSVRVHERGEEVASLLVDRLADAAEEHGHGLLIVLQWLPETNSRRAEAMLKRARERDVLVLKIEGPLRSAIDSPAFSEDDFFNVTKHPGGGRQVGHMSAEGNAFVARAIAQHPSLQSP
jgi:hypothetical protein